MTYTPNPDTLTRYGFTLHRPGIYQKSVGKIQKFVSRYPTGWWLITELRGQIISTVPLDSEKSLTA